MSIVQPAMPPPQLHLPHSPHTVAVSIINTTAHLSQIPSALFIGPAYQGHKLMNITNFAFLIEHNGQKLHFDLGVRKDWEASSPPSLVGPMKLSGWNVEVEKNVSETLQDNGTSLDSIDAIIWRYEYDRNSDQATLIQSLVITTLPTQATPQHSHTRPRWSSDQASKGFLPLRILKMRTPPFLNLLTLVVKSERSPSGEALN